jgi:DNA-binding Lrp family transcriptional regulator
MVDGKLDSKDIQILNLLSKDARLSYSDIGDHIGLTRTASKNRVVAMEKAGIIKGYHADISLHEAPEMTTFITYIDTTPECFEEAKAAVSSIKEAVTVVQRTGSCKLVAVCVAKSNQALKDSLNRLFKIVPGIQEIYAHTIIDVIKGTVIPDNLMIEVLANDERTENDGVNQ